jgi:predicted RNA-binding Zn ribbon-like protein
MPNRSQNRSARADKVPEELRCILAFLNTLDPRVSDELDSPEALGEWIARHGLAAPAPIVPASWNNALAVRQGLRALIAVHSGAPLHSQTVQQLNRALGEMRYQVGFSPDATTLHQQPAEAGWPGTLSRLFHAVSLAMADGRWQRFKLCANGKCQGVFYDASNSRTGRWCDVRCGNQVNCGTYRRRRPSNRYRY